MKKLSILMCTYNSEDFVRTQLDSILGQTYEDWHLYVRDDGSTDATPRILQDYASKDARISIVEDAEKRGAKHGFMWLLQQVDADYYMFCDHDDFWLPAKIEKSMALMLGQDDKDTTPIIVCTNTKLADAGLNVTAESYWDYKCYRSAMFSDKYYHLVYNNVLGCTMLFNRAARAVALPYPPETAMHDSWLAASVLWGQGRIMPVEEPLMLYRQHSRNTIGAPQVPSLWQQLKKGPQLYHKTVVQHEASLPLVNMPFVQFFLLKFKYMLQEHIRVYLKRRHS